MTTRMMTGTVKRSDGSPWSRAVLRVQKLALGARPGEVYPAHGFDVRAGLDGEIPPTPLAVPETGAWLRRITFPDSTHVDFYLSAGEPITLDEILALAGQPAHEADTPAGELLLAMYSSLAEAEEGEVWTAGQTAATWSNSPRGYWMQRTAVGDGESVTIPAGHQMVVVGSFRVDGTLEVNGELVVL